MIRLGPFENQCPFWLQNPEEWDPSDRAIADLLEILAFERANTKESIVSLREAMGSEVCEGSGLFELVQILISQRDNTRNALQAAEERAQKAEALVLKSAEAMGWKQHHEKGNTSSLEFWDQSKAFKLDEDLPTAIASKEAELADLRTRLEKCMNPCPNGHGMQTECYGCQRDQSRANEARLRAALEECADALQIFHDDKFNPAKQSAYHSAKAALAATPAEPAGEISKGGDEPCAAPVTTDTKQQSPIARSTQAASNAAPDGPTPPDAAGPTVCSHCGGSGWGHDAQPPISPATTAGGETPRTDAIYSPHSDTVPVHFARQLERELNSKPTQPEGDAKDGAVQDGPFMVPPFDPGKHAQSPVYFVWWSWHPNYPHWSKSCWKAKTQEEAFALAALHIPGYHNKLIREGEGKFVEVADLPCQRPERWLEIAAQNRPEHDAFRAAMAKTEEARG